jgi:hypothetical protein
MSMPAFYPARQEKFRKRLCSLASLSEKMATMPIHECQSGGKTGQQWGGQGKCYTGPGAHAKAAKQAQAARANGYEGHGEDLPEEFWERFCQEGPNKGKPGPCPEATPQSVAAPAASKVPSVSVSSTPTSPGQPASNGRASVLRTLLQGTKDTGEAAKAMASQVGSAAWQKLPAKAQQALGTAYRVGKAVEAKVMIGFHKTREVAQQAAKERGLPDTYVERVGKILGTADLTLAWTVNFPAVAAATGSLTAGKVSSWIPVASLGYLAMSTARNPLATIRAARKVMAGQATKHADAKKNVPGFLTEFLARSDNPDWSEALVCAALDQTHDLGEAIAMAAQAQKQQPMKAAECFNEQGGIIKGCEIFRVGRFRGKEYTPADLDSMVENFRKFSTGPKALLNVPAVLGHEEQQELLERSDVPAAAWTTHLYREGPILKADFEGVPPDVVKLLRGKRYRKVSAEVYDDPPEGVPGKGKMLRRVAYLGGDIPQIKDLKDIPLPESMSEKQSQWRPTVLRFLKIVAKKNGIHEVFAEVSMPSREEMCAKLQERGFDQAVLEGMSDEQLAEILRVYGDQPQQNEPDNSNPNRPAPMDDTTGASVGGGMDPNSQSDPAMTNRMADDGAPPNRDGYAKDTGVVGGPTSQDPALQEVKLSEYADGELPEPQSPEDEEKLKKAATAMMERAKKMMEKYHGQSCMSDDGEGLAQPASPGPSPMSQDDNTNPKNTQANLGEPMSGPRQPTKRVISEHFSEEKLAQIVSAEVAKALKGQVQSSIDELTKFAETEKAARKKDSVEAFCEASLKAGRLTAAEYKSRAAGGPDGSVYRRLLRADSQQVVTKFKETTTGKMVELTEFDMQKREIEQRPTLFGERFKDGGYVAPSSEDEIKTKLVEKFHELQPGFEKAGSDMTEQKFVETWLKAPAKDRAKLLAA